ncbi:hypothetical protein LBMAG53_08390 [Planctomycetota bacterium]|nr:hypothetical protein LBMAG53_08390 [Planctomycetota bacterium]
MAEFASDGYVMMKDFAGSALRQLDPPGSARLSLPKDGHGRLKSALPGDPAEPVAVSSNHHRTGAAATHAGRDALAWPWVRWFLSDGRLHAAIADLIGPAVAIAGRWFDKVPGANWQVPWHRDLLVPVAQRIDAPGWTGWCEKDGIAHARPPNAIGRARCTARLHLDPVDADGGALRIRPGSHHDPDRMQPAAEVVLPAAVGDLLLIHPWLLHASRPARTPTRRRVLHLEFCSMDPTPVSWHEPARSTAFACEVGLRPPPECSPCPM